MTRDCSGFRSSTAGPLQTGLFGSAPLRTGLFGCAFNCWAIPWFHFEPIYAYGVRDPGHANSHETIGDLPRVFVGHLRIVGPPKKRPAHIEHPGGPKFET